jgi:hypothetical protein
MLLHDKRQNVTMIYGEGKSQLRLATSGGRTCVRTGSVCSTYVHAWSANAIKKTGTTKASIMVLGGESACFLSYRASGAIHMYGSAEFISTCCSKTSTTSKKVTANVWLRMSVLYMVRTHRPAQIVF